jgi:hypothetical protein
VKIKVANFKYLPLAFELTSIRSESQDTKPAPSRSYQHQHQPHHPTLTSIYTQPNIRSTQRQIKMPSPERVRDSCSNKIHNRILNVSRECKIITFTILILLLTSLLVCLALGLAYPHATATSFYGATIKARVPDTTTVVVYGTATATVASLLTPTPTTHTSIAVQRGFTSGAIAGICIAVICAALLLVILLTCVARCMASRIGRMTRAGDHRPGNFCGEDHSARVPSVKKNIGADYSLRDLSEGNGNVGESTTRDHSAG